MKNPINQRRWENFKSNRRGWYSLWIFSVLFTVALFSEIVANDKPIVVSYDEQIYFPFLFTYSELEFGGEFETEADYRDEFVAELINAKGYLIFPPIPFSYNTINYDLSTPAPSPPDSVNWLGTDDQGRDVLARILYGFRISVIFGITLTFFSTIIGVFAGAIQGYYGGKLDLIMRRLIEIWDALPMLFLLIILASIVTPSFWWLLGIMLLFSWMSLVRIVRAEFLRGRNLDYVKAAKALGLDDKTIMIRHVLPNAMVSTLTFMPFILTSSITTLTALDFLGFGLPVGDPSLGELIAQGKSNLQAPWLGISAFVVLSIMLSLLVFIGEAVRDAFDPRLN